MPGRESLPLKLLFLGFLTALIGMLLLATSVILSPEFKPAEVSVGGFILIGFIPIAFGYGPWAWLLVILAAAVTIALLVIWAKRLKPWLKKNLT